MITMTLKNKAVSQYLKLKANAFCAYQGGILAACDDGLFLLTGATDAGTAIDGYVEFPCEDFGDDRTRLRWVSIGWDGGDLAVDVTVGDVTQSYTATQGKSEFTIRRDQQGRFWTMKIANVCGCDMALDRVIAEIVRK